MAADPDFLLSIDDVRAFERLHGPLPEGGWLLYRTGWDARAHDQEAFLNADDTGPHTPGISIDCAKWLAEEAPIVGVGVETVGTDAGAAHSFDPPFPCHSFLLGANKYGLTQLANLSQLPADGCRADRRAAQDRERLGQPVPRAGPRAALTAGVPLPTGDRRPSILSTVDAMSTAAVVLGLLAALGYGSSDFSAGIGGRRTSVGGVVVAQQPVAALATVIIWALYPSSSPTAAALAWGALSGFGNGFGTVALYRGLAVARMSVVASLSAVLAAVIPATVGIALGDHLSAPEAAGMVLAIPAIALVSLSAGSEGGRRPGIREGLIAGAAFGFFFVALDRAGTASGAWPLLPGEAVTLAIAIPLGLSDVPRGRTSSSGDPVRCGRRRPRRPGDGVVLLRHGEGRSLAGRRPHGALPGRDDRPGPAPPLRTLEPIAGPGPAGGRRLGRPDQRRLRPVLTPLLKIAVLRRELVRPAR